MAYEDDAISRGRDVRRREALDESHESWESIDWDQVIAARMQAIHCRLLQTATRGRLTWEGDRVVSTGSTRRTDAGLPLGADVPVPMNP